MRENATKQPPFWNTNEWSDYVAYCVQTYRDLNNIRSLNHHDWDDIIQTCRIHIWQNRRFYQRNRPLKPWLKTLALNRARNEVRARFTGKVKSKRQTHFRWLVQHPQPLLTRTVTVDALREEVRYEPDMIDSRSDRRVIEEVDLGEMQPKLRETLRILRRIPSLTDAACAETGIVVGPNARKKRTARKLKSAYHRLWSRRVKLQNLYRKALDTTNRDLVISHDT